MRADTEQEILKTELWWTALVSAIVTAIMLAIIYAGVVHHINPPSNIETIDPKTLHLTGEFTEGNLGTSVEAGGQVTSRIVATQFAFQPQCIVVPANRTVTLRFATPDVIHGILVTGTNVNTMIVPGYVSQVHTVFTKTGDLLMPCHEYLRPRPQPDVGDACGSCPSASSSPAPTGGRPVTHARRLTLAHLWVAFAAFAVASVLGVWQMWARSPCRRRSSPPGLLSPR